MERLILGNGALRLGFDPSTGALVEFTATEGGGWHVLDRPHLGLSFRLLVPLPGRRNNEVLGQRQRLSSVEVEAAGRSALFQWRTVESEHGGEHSIAVTLRVRLDERQALWETTIENRSELVVENVYLPYFGDVAHPPGDGGFRALRWEYMRARAWPLWPTYQNTRGYYGVDHPIQLGAGHTAGVPAAPFLLLQGEERGLYIGTGSTSPELVAWQTELVPGYSSSVDERVPAETVVGGKDVATQVAAVQVPYIQPGDTRELTPIVVEPYLGGWQRGADIYRRWRAGVMSFATPPAWAQEPHSWIQLHINSPEDELRMPFRDLVKVGEACARHGVKAIQLVGWNHGGQDQGNPSHDHDPRLGTADELRAAIKAIQSLGVKLILFTKFVWADRATDWFRTDLIHQAVKDPWGDYYMHPGYQYQTATQLLDVNTKRLIPMCFSSEAYLRVCEEEFRKVLSYGADGMLFDECLHHGPALLCFDPAHDHRAGAPVYANDRELIRRFRGMLGQDQQAYLFAGEACYDWEFEEYHLSYGRIRALDDLPLSRYLAPDTPLMMAVTGFDDRNALNHCLLHRYVVSYEPYNFKGSLDDFPLTMTYGTQVDALRTELREWVWDGEYMSQDGASVTADRHQPFGLYTTYRSRRTGTWAAVAANTGRAQPVRLDARLRDGRPFARYRLVDDPTWRSAERGVEVPPQSAAVILEK